MSTSTMYQFRIDPQDKADTFEIFNNMGLKPAQAVRLFFTQVRKTKSIPFPIEYQPNAETIQSMKDSEAGIGIKSFDTDEDMFSHLHSLLK